MRRINFQNGRYYHVFNRGVDKRQVFADEKDYYNFLARLRDFNNKSKFEQRYYAQKELNSLSAKELSSLPRLVELIAYCLNPNHFHLLLRQKQEAGIEKYMHKISTGYTNYFNRKNERSGSLFQGRYKAVEIKTDAQLLYVSAYINGNPAIHQVNPADKWPWSSCQDYLGKRSGTLCNKQIILKEFKNIAEYEEYMGEVIKNSRDIKEEIKKCILE